jgi:hypothetical protein
MLLFLISIVFVSYIAASLVSYSSSLREKLSEIELSSAAESSARASEVAYRCGISMEKSIESRIEEKMYVDAGNRLIEVDGVFEYDPREPA